MDNLWLAMDSVRPLLRLEDDEASSPLDEATEEDEGEPRKNDVED